MEISESKRGYILLRYHEVKSGNTPEYTSKEAFPTPMTVWHKDDLSKVAKRAVSLGYAGLRAKAYSKS